MNAAHDTLTTTNSNLTFARAINGPGTLTLSPGTGQIASLTATIGIATPPPP